MSKEIGIDRKSKETVSFSDYDVPLSQLSTANLMKPPLEKFSAYNYSGGPKAGVSNEAVCTRKL